MNPVAPIMTISPLVWGLFAVTVAMDMWGQIAFKLGLNSLARRPAGQSAGGPASWWAMVIHPWILAGLAGYGLEMVCWLYVVGHAPLTVIGPMAAIAYVGVVLAGKLFLHEQPDLRRWVGAGLVSLGAAILGFSIA